MKWSAGVLAGWIESVSLSAAGRRRASRRGRRRSESFIVGVRDLRESESQLRRVL